MITLVWKRFRFFTDIPASRAFRSKIDQQGHLMKAELVGTGILVAWDYEGVA